MALPKKSHGTAFFIGTNTTALASETAWTAIGGAYASGTGIGLSWGSTDATTFADAVKQTFKTVADAGDIEISMRLDIADAGQIALKAAASDKSNVPYNFKIEIDDDNPSAGNNPTKFTFQCRVMSYEFGPGNTNSLYEAKSKLVLSTIVTQVAAAA